MELANVTSKGQITIPIMIRKLLKLEDGDKVAFIEKDDGFMVVNPVSLAVDKARKEFAGELEKDGLNNEEDVARMINQLREERNN